MTLKMFMGMLVHDWDGNTEMKMGLILVTFSVVWIVK